MKRFFQNYHPILLVLVITIVACNPKVRTWEVNSPDGEITFKLTFSRFPDQNRTELSYQVFMETDTGILEIIEPSVVGIRRKDDSFTDNMVFDSEDEEIEFTDQYQLIAGKKRKINYSGNELSVSFRNDSSQLIALDLRALNNGVAFRYRFPEIDSTIYTVTGEITSFNIPTAGKAWIQPYDTVTKDTPAYETYYTNGSEIGGRSPGGQGWSFPALFQVHNAWILITEANLKDNFYGAHLQPEASDGVYRIRLPEKEEALGTCDAEPSSTLPWVMPWRVIMIGKTLGEIVESTLVEDLSDPSEIEDISWIQPGRASWSWWSDHDSPQDFQKLAEFVDLAAEMGWEYTLVDANWNRMKGGKLEDLVDYSKEKNVGVLVWYNSGGPHNTVEEEVRNIMNDREKRREEFAKLQEWGVKGVKIDFFQSDKAGIIKMYHDMLRDAADYQMLVNFHGCTLPRGWERTYPHLMSMEAVRGEECYSYDKSYPENAPRHNTILPYTRNTVGPMDYTPVAFSNQTYPHLTTYGHEIALPVIFHSGILHFADRTSIFRELPEFAKEFLKDIPVSWDQTRFLDGYPGEYIVLAREHEGTWYFGGINGTGENYNIALEMPFLPEGSYLAEIITDGEDDRSFMYYKKPFRNTSSLDIALKPYGGFTGRLLEFMEAVE